MNIPFLDLKLGLWAARILFYSSGAGSLLERIRDGLGHAAALFAPAEVPRYVVVIAQEEIGELPPPRWLPEECETSWSRFCGAWRRDYRRYCETGNFSERELLRKTRGFLFSWPRALYDRPGDDFVERGASSYQYVGLILGDQAKTLHLHAMAQCNYLATAWHVARGGLLIHSAAAARADSGFLFLGDSGAGKTTVSRISNAIGLSTLGDDLNFLLPTDNGHTAILAAPSLRMQTFGYESVQPSLRAIFSLCQDARDFLSPLTPLRTAELLVRASYQAPFVPRLPEPGVRRAFRNACTIARDIPGYEMHFTEAPSFWNLIDQTFPP